VEYLRLAVATLLAGAAGHGLARLAALADLPLTRFHRTLPPGGTGLSTRNRSAR
jgi:hypothetical protein